MVALTGVNWWLLRRTNVFICQRKMFRKKFSRREKKIKLNEFTFCKLVLLQSSSYICARPAYRHDFFNTIFFFIFLQIRSWNCLKCSQQTNIWPSFWVRIFISNIYLWIHVCRTNSDVGKLLCNFQSDSEHIFGGRNNSIKNIWMKRICFFIANTVVI